MVRQAELPAPPPPGSGLAGATGVLGPSDVLSIDVYGVEDLKRERVEIDSSGNVGFPLAGNVPAAGRTPQQLSDDITQRLRRMVRNPIVTVNVVETRSVLITVDGQVRKPGQYPVRGTTTLVSAISQAEGLTDYAKDREVVVFRTIGTKKYAALYDLDAIRRGIYADPRLYANDTIVVGDSPARRTMRDLLQAGPLLAAPLITVLL